MFNNIGGKIKGLATIICLVGMIGSVIAAFAMWANEAFLPGLVILVVGCLASWIGSFFAYGLGQLIENTDRIRERLENPYPAAMLSDAPMKDTPDDTEEQDTPLIPLTREQRRDGWACPHCRFINSADRSKCAFCGKAK